MALVQAQRRPINSGARPQWEDLRLRHPFETLGKTIDKYNDHIVATNPELTVLGGTEKRSDALRDEDDGVESLPAIHAVAQPLLEQNSSSQYEPPGL